MTGCEHVEAMQAAVSGKGDCPVCAQQDRIEQAELEVASVQAEEQKLIQEGVEGPKPKRQKKGEILSIMAKCHGCNWAMDSKNAMGLAAQHHDHTGHTVSVKQVLRVVFGDPEDAPSATEQDEVF